MQERLEKSIKVKLTEVDNYCDYIIKYPFSYKYTLKYLGVKSCDVCDLLLNEKNVYVCIFV